MNTKRLDKIKRELGISVFNLNQFDGHGVEYIYIPDGYPDKLTFPFADKREIRILRINEEHQEVYAGLKIKRINEEIVLILPNQISTAYSFFFVRNGMLKWLVASHSAISAANYLKGKGLINEVDFLSDL